MEKICTHCGTTIAIDSLRCPSCGRRQDHSSMRLSIVNVLYVFMGLVLFIVIISLNAR